jgi:L-Ala-D/L-Glu epimerase
MTVIQSSASNCISELALTLTVERFAYHQPFRISGHVFTETAVLVAELSDGQHRGRGEGAGVYYLGDDIGHMLAEATRVKHTIERGATRADLQHLLPPGGARNALDCAFWDLEAKQSGKPVWQLAGLSQPQPLSTTLTLGADDAQAMARAARALDPLGSGPIKVLAQ